MNFDQPTIDWNHTDLHLEFQRFKQHVDFVFKGPLAKSDAADKAGWIGIWIGQQGREIHKTFKWSDTEKEDDPNAVMKMFENYVLPQKNKRVARFKLSQRVQQEEESFDNFLKDLHLLAMDCEFGDTDDALVDSIIRGVAHPKVQE